MDPKPQVCTLLFLLRPGEILLGMKKRGFGSNRWNGVGGKVEPGETIEQALVRECQEEIGVTPTNYRKVAVHDFLFPDKTQNIQMHTYFATAWQGAAIETEEMTPVWFKIPEIPYDDMWQDDLVWLPQVLLGKKVAGGFVFNDKEQMIGAEMRFVSHLN